MTYLVETQSVWGIWRSNYESFDVTDVGLLVGDVDS